MIILVKTIFSLILISRSNEGRFGAKGKKVHEESRKILRNGNETKWPKLVNWMGISYFPIIHGNKVFNLIGL